MSFHFFISVSGNLYNFLPFLISGPFVNSRPFGHHVLRVLQIPPDDLSSDDLQAPLEFELPEARPPGTPRSRRCSRFTSSRAKFLFGKRAKMYKRSGRGRHTINIISPLLCKTRPKVVRAVGLCYLSVNIAPVLKIINVAKTTLSSQNWENPIQIYRPHALYRKN